MMRQQQRYCCPVSGGSGGGCPMSGGATTSKQKKASSSANGECPVMGKVQETSCPVETEENITMGPKAILSQLGKAKLSAFVTSTASVGYILSGGTSPIVCAAVTAGAFLQSCSANAANQIIEVENDRMMKRTCRRPLVIGAITKFQAAQLLTVQLGLGTAMLYAFSPTAAALGVANWAMYVCVYTPLKRVSTTNTWWGAIVGAVPPVMGGIAACGSLADPLMAYAYLLGGVLFVWQIPHFMSLAFHCRRDYEGAGFKMLAFNHPTRASVYAVSLSVVMAAMTIAGPACIGQPVEPWFYAGSAVLNALMVWKSYKFHVDPVRYCRTCFVFSYMYLAMMLTLLAVNYAQPITRVMRVVSHYQTPHSSSATDAAASPTATTVEN